MMTRYPEIKKQNLRMFLLVIVGIALTLILMSLPLYTFDIGVYTKKSANTFVGDEKYAAARAEAEAVAADYRAQGFNVEISEDVVERVNSKGVTTSLVTFTISEQNSRNCFAFLRQNLPSSYALLCMLALMGLSVLFIILGLIGSADILHRYLDNKSCIFRNLAIAALVIAILLVPVFVLMNNVTFSRHLSLYNAGLLTDGKEAFYGKMDQFLFAGEMGENIQDVLSGLDIEHAKLIWLLIPTLFISLIGAISIRKGEIKNSLARGSLYFFIVVVCITTLYPYYVMLITAFRSNAESLDMYFLHMFPTEWIWSNLTDIIHIKLINKLNIIK